MKRLLIACLLMMLLVIPIVAQDAPEIPVDIVDGSTLFLEELLTSLGTLVYLPFAGTLVFVLTAFSKRVVGVDARLQSLAWSVVVWGAYVIAARAGFAEQFQTAVPAIATLLATTLGITITPATASRIYDAAADQRIPILGYSKTPAGLPVEVNSASYDQN